MPVASRQKYSFDRSHDPLRFIAEPYPKKSGPSDFGRADPVGVCAGTAGLTLSPARRRDAKEETGDRSANRADFQALIGASMPDAVGVSSEKINARYYPE
ncbi:hypothetical protein [Burkholderia sp. BCC1993]|uniref:hypothetical protein n=1 Tax=Burkholderia sp. BCC1993 TaxID=2817444 RepID=UPI002AB1180B|nr:hypothetical protein [Burkholderia sp. BCC1993]